MAVQQSDQRQDGYRKYPIDDHGKFRLQFFSVGVITPVAVAFAANDQIELFKLPPGRKRILPHASRLVWSAFGAGRTLAIGHRAYAARSPADAAAEPENATAFATAVDVSAAQPVPQALGSVLKYDMYSYDEAVVFATVLGGTMPVGATLSGYMAYIYE